MPDLQPIFEELRQRMSLHEDVFLEAMSPELLKRMQGKSCFSFTKADVGLFEELSAITAKGRDLFAAQGWLATPPV